MSGRMIGNYSETWPYRLAQDAGAEFTKGTFSSPGQNSVISAMTDHVVVFGWFRAVGS